MWTERAHHQQCMSQAKNAKAKLTGILELHGLFVQFGRLRKERQRQSLRIQNGTKLTEDCIDLPDESIANFGGAFSDAHAVLYSGVDLSFRH